MKQMYRTALCAYKCFDLIELIRNFKNTTRTIETAIVSSRRKNWFHNGLLEVVVTVLQSH